jgi:hypothetical protein
MSALIATLLLTAACRVGERRYEGKEVCQLIDNKDIEKIFSEPFRPGERMGLDNDGNSHIGSECDFESVARAPGSPKNYKFRVMIEVRTVEPNEADVAAQQKEYQTSKYNGKIFYHKVQEIPGIADGAFGAFDPYYTFMLYSIFKPDVRMEVHVYNVVEDEAVDRGKAVAQLLERRLREEGVAAKPR